MIYCHLGGINSINILPSLQHLITLYLATHESLGLFWREKRKLWFWLAQGDNMTGCLPIPEKLLLEVRLMVCIDLVCSGSKANGGYWPILINLSYMTLPCLEFILFFL